MSISTLAIFLFTLFVEPPADFHPRVFIYAVRQVVLYDFFPHFLEDLVDVMPGLRARLHEAEPMLIGQSFPLHDAHFPLCLGHVGFVGDQDLDDFFGDLLVNLQHPLF